MAKNAALAAASLAALSAGGCASARMSDHESDSHFRSGRYDDAASSLREGLRRQGPEGRDRLLYLLDLGLTLHTAGRYAESNEALREADKIAEIKDYTSLATEGATLLASENVTDYKGEDFEKVLINTYLAMNYALMGELEDALVEARLVNRKLHLMATEGKRKYKQNAFARYLSAVVYEADREYADAYIDYKHAWKLEPAYPGIGRDLWRMAWLQGLPEDMERWDEEFKLAREDHEAARAAAPRSGKGEVIVIYENGISPIKRPNPSWHSLPAFYPRFNPVTHAAVEVDGRAAGLTASLHDVEATAIANLEEKYGGMVAKKVGGVLAKEIVSDQIERQTNNPVLGLLSRLFLYLGDQADVRSWNLLPKDLQVARVVVEPGKHALRVTPIGGEGPLPEKTVEVGKGRKVFVAFRYVPH